MGAEGAQGGKEGADLGIEGHGIVAGKGAGPGGVMRHGRAGPAEEGDEVGFPELDPGGDGAGGGMPSEFGEDGEGQEGGEGIAQPLSFTGFGDGAQVGDERLQREGEGLRAELRRKREAGRVHRKPPFCG